MSSNTTKQGNNLNQYCASCRLINERLASDIDFKCRTLLCNPKVEVRVDYSALILLYVSK